MANDNLHYSWLVSLSDTQECVDSASVFCDIYLINANFLQQ